MQVLLALGPRAPLSWHVVMLQLARAVLQAGQACTLLTATPRLFEDLLPAGLQILPVPQQTPPTFLQVDMLGRKAPGAQFAPGRYRNTVLADAEYVAGEGACYETLLQAVRPDAVVSYDLPLLSMISPVPQVALTDMWTRLWTGAELELHGADQAQEMDREQLAEHLLTLVQAGVLEAGRVEDFLLERASLTIGGFLFPPSTAAPFYHPMMGGGHQQGYDVVAHLSLEWAGTEDMALALIESGQRAGVHIDGIAPQLRSFLQQAGVDVLTHPEAFLQAVPAASRVVHHGDILTAEMAVQAAIPQLLLPYDGQHAVVSQQLQKLGMAEVLDYGPQLLQRAVDALRQPPDMDMELWEALAMSPMCPVTETVWQMLKQLSVQTAGGGREHRAAG